MTQEEKARAYDKVREKIALRFGSNVSEEIFSEFEESEDERIRKEIISALKYANHKGVYDKHLAWLEKQGEKQQKTPIWKHWKNGIAGNGEGKPIYLVKHGYTYSLSSCLGTECDYIELSELDKLLSEEQGEQKPADKVKPKFKVGDWVVHNERKNIIKIVNCTPLNYKVVNILGYHHTITDTAIENNYHIWTIQDAKDGDVLACENGWMCVFKALDNHTNTFSSHCFMDADGWFCIDGGEGHTLDNRICGEIHLATEEQRDTFKKAMNDAGYTFDFVNKELKEIEDEPENFKKQVMPEMTDLVKQKPNWSEEDEHRVKNTIYFLDTAKKHYVSTVELDACIDWIKSLKDRYTWKPSDEQLEVFEHFVRSVGESGYASPYDNNTKLLYSLLSDLKKLRKE